MKFSVAGLRIYSIISMALPFSYMIIASFFVERTTINMTIEVFLLALLYINAAIIVPIVLRRNLPKETGDSFFKIIYILSVVLAIFVTVGVYFVVVSGLAVQWIDGWIVVAILLGHILWILLLVFAWLLTPLITFIFFKVLKINENSRNSESHMFSKYVRPSLFLALMQWSLFILSATILVVF